MTQTPSQPWSRPAFLPEQGVCTEWSSMAALKEALDDAFIWHAAPTAQRPQAGVSIAPLTHADLKEIQLRHEDQEELLLGGSTSPEDLAPRLAGHWAATARDREGSILAIFGAVCGGGFVSPWLLCTDLIGEHKKTMHRQARDFVALLDSLAPEGAPVANRISKAASSARRFVQSLGFVIHSVPGSHDFFSLTKHV